MKFDPHWQVHPRDRPKLQWKVCSACGESKVLTSYYREKSSKDGYKSKCPACVKSSAKKGVL